VVDGIYDPEDSNQQGSDIMVDGTTAGSWFSGFYASGKHCGNIYPLNLRSV
jgi:hypothetical protein